VTRRTRDEHEQIALALRQVARLEPGQRLLDFGCGHALGTGLHVEAGIEVVLADQSAAYRSSAAERWGLPVHDLQSIREIEPVHALCAFSVLQYLADEELDALLALAQAKLLPGGTLILGDIIPPDLTLARDLGDLLPRAWSPRRLAEHLWSVGTLVLGGRYLATRRSQPLRTWSEEDLRARLLEAGFEAERLPNIGPNKARMTWLGRKPDGGARSGGAS